MVKKQGFPNQSKPFQLEPQNRLELFRENNQKRQLVLEPFRTVLISFGFWVVPGAILNRSGILLGGPSRTV